VRGLRSIIRVQRWRLDEKRRELRDLQKLEEELQRALADLEAELGREQGAAAGTAEASFTYGGYAQSVIDRRERLQDSLSKVVRQIADATDALARAFEELKKVEMTAAMRQRAAEAEAERTAQRTLDDIAAVAHARRRLTEAE
jgi:flagellar export protein FliJ